MTIQNWPLKPRLLLALAAGSLWLLDLLAGGLWLPASPWVSVAGSLLATAATVGVFPLATYAWKGQRSGSSPFEAERHALALEAAEQHAKALQAKVDTLELALSKALK